MPELSVGDVARITGGHATGDASVRAGSMVGDSREVSATSAFVAIRGGHDFIGEAISSGAPYVVAERSEAVPEGASAVVVGDVVAALHALAAHVRPLLRATAVGITGSVGKTLTKDLVAAASGAGYRVHASPRSFNTEIGVPLVLLSCPDDAQVLVVELGARHRGEIGELCALVEPRVGIITAISSSHLGEFGSRRAIAETKAELLASLPADGLALVPSDSAFLGLLASSTSSRLSTVGPGGHVRFRASRLDADHTVGQVWLDDHPVRVSLPLPGRALMRNAAFALAAASELGVDVAAAAAAMADAPTSAWRMQVATHGSWHLVNDAYNANPVSMVSALRTVRELAGDAPVWAVLGEMAELGDAGPAEHRRAGRLAASLGYGIIAVGGGMADAYADATGERICVDDIEEAVDVALDRVPSGAWVLVKGSRVTGLERFETLLDGQRTRP